jgi:hypothetical protein
MATNPSIAEIQSAGLYSSGHLRFSNHLRKLTARQSEIRSRGIPLTVGYRATEKSL